MSDVDFALMFGTFVQWSLISSETGSSSDLDSSDWDPSGMPRQAEEPANIQGGSFLQARCDEVLVTNDWCLPLVLALLLLLLIYTFLYLPSLAHHNTTR